MPVNVCSGLLRQIPTATFSSCIINSTLCGRTPFRIKYFKTYRRSFYSIALDSAASEMHCLVAAVRFCGLVDPLPEN